MSGALTPIDIRYSPDILHLAEEVRKTKIPRVLEKDHEAIAVLMPIGTDVRPKKRREKTQADYDAFKSAAGGWKDIVDVEQLKKDISESRKLSTRPPIEL